ncbi:MAG TPA: hypothetical protein VN213_18300 [Solirubrobacteraceae bacterium]|nr:hypothetical protein [Solirubrobacteraceae bacterium]
MSDGLPDAVVEGTPESVVRAAEAYARAVAQGMSATETVTKRNAFKAEVVALNEDVRGRVLAEALEHHEAAALAALPAGLYRSDGKGNVTPLSESEARELLGPAPGVMHPVDKAFYELEVKERNYERVRVDRLQRELAALSATDTEEHRDE